MATYEELKKSKITELKQLFESKSLKEHKNSALIMSELQNIIDFIEFIPSNDAFAEILYLKWQGMTDKQIAASFGIKKNKLVEIYKYRHKELLKMFYEKNKATV